MENVEENNDAPVLNVEETQSGEGLVDSAGSTESQKENSEETNESDNTSKEEDQEIDAFDPKAFLNTESSVDSNEDSEKQGTDESDDSQAWPDLPNDTSDDLGSDDSKNEDNESERTPESENTPVDINKEQFDLFTKELGIEASSIDEIKDALASIIEENTKLKESSVPNETNKRVEDLEKFSKLDDENLVRKSLEADGLTGDKLDHTIDRLLDSGLIDVEALKIRNNVEKAIQSERQNIVKSRDDEQAKLVQDQEEAVESFSKFMQSTDTLFDFKLTNNPDNLPAVRKNHTEYVTSGKYLNEITSSEQNLAESSWLWRNREVLKNAMINNGRQNGRKEILDQIGRPETNKPQRFVTPDNGEFDPKAFMNG